MQIRAALSRRAKALTSAFGLTEDAHGVDQFTRCQSGGSYAANSSSSAFASFRSRVSNPLLTAVYGSLEFARLPHLALVAPEAREARSGALGGQQRRGDGCPFRRKITGCQRTACLAIPITGIVEITLNAVQVSVNPCAVRAFAVGDNLVRCIPIVVACPLKRH